MPFIAFTPLSDGEPSDKFASFMGPDLIWLLFASGLAWFVLERKKPKEKQSAGFISIITIVSWFVFKLLYQAVIISPGGTSDDALLTGLLFGGATLLIGIGIKWLLTRKKQAHTIISSEFFDTRLQSDYTPQNNPSTEGVGSSKAKTLEQPHGRMQTPRTNTRNISMSQRIILVLIIAAIAVGSIAYIGNVENYKIGQYTLNSVNSGSAEGFFDLTDYEEKLILNSDPYIKNKRQNFIIYSTLITVIALGLSYLVMRPARKLP